MTIQEHIKLYLMGMSSPFTSTQATLDYLATFNEKFPGYYHTPIQNLSGGEKQLLVLALVLLRKPKLLLLDEHTSALDPKTAKNIMDITNRLVQDNNITCIMTTHALEQATDYGNQLVALRNGKIHHHYDATEKKTLTPEILFSCCYTFE